jgi:hypothetical protein
MGSKSVAENQPALAIDLGPGIRRDERGEGWPYDPDHCRTRPVSTCTKFEVG